MAKTKVKFSHDVEGGGKMARQVEQQPTAGKINRTPAPDQISMPRHPSAAGSGMNNDPNASSIEPGKRVVSPLGQNLETSVDDKGALDAVISKGTARIDSAISGQLRDIAAGNVPAAHGMVRQQADYPGIAKAIPASPSSASSAPARKPT
jgi:hypothetical protein